MPSHRVLDTMCAVTTQPCLSRSMDQVSQRQCDMSWEFRSPGPNFSLKNWLTQLATHCCTCSSSGVKYKWLSSVHHILWQRWDPLPASQGQGPLADVAAAEGVRKRVVQIARTCSARAGLLWENDTQQLSQLESLGEQRLPRGQEGILLPRVRELPGKRRSLGAKVAARERGTLSGPGSLPERAMIAEIVA